MFQVLVVDDEPSAVEYLCDIIRMRCPELSVIATAKNGEEGFTKFCEFIPDLVISDVMMPVMDGLDMVKAIKETEEETAVVLVSSYQEFDYVRTALQYGVSDYILKPVTPAGFQKAVEPVILVMHQKVYEKRKKLARFMIIGEKGKEKEILRYFKEDAYYVSVLRENGLPRRLTDTCEIEQLSEPEGVMFVYGRDEREVLYICPGKAVSQEEFAEFIEVEGGKKKGKNNFVTTVMAKNAVPTRQLGTTVERIYEEMNRHLSIGVTQTVYVEEETPENRRDCQEKLAEFGERQLYGEEIMRRLDRSLERRDRKQVVEELSGLVKKAEEIQCPQLYLEQIIRQFSAKVRRSFNSRPDVLEEEMMFEDAFYEAGTSQELTDSLKSILIRYWKENREPVKLDSPEFLDNIKEYIESHFSSDLTVSSMCSEFHVSQSYLNLIFRKHGMESFNTYLRNIRVKKAREIMERNPEMFIKDVALMVGYRDQFYFSRIFRAVTGISPSEYPRGRSSAS